MSLASGPQVVYNIDRLPEGENVTQLYPWKIWQVTADPLGSSSKPVEFYQPSTQAQELMTVYEKFATLADEYTGIPRYMTGGAATGGAARTASGMSMLMTNAGKSIKQVIANIDEHVIKPCIDRLYYYNMRYSDDPDLKGDVDIVARGAASILEKEQAQQRRNEFLQIALNSPAAQQVVGMEGIAELLRQAAGTLDMNVDKIVPSPEQMKIKEAQAQAMQQAQQQAQDPLIQLQQQELQIKAQDQQRKAAKDQTDAQLKMEQLQIERERIRAQQHTAGAQTAAKVMADRDSRQAAERVEGQKAGIEMVKHKTTLAHQNDIAKRQHDAQKQQKEQPKKGK
jgi:hypothetical protein